MSCIKNSGITFNVAPVSSAAQLLPEQQYNEALKRQIGNFEACSLSGGTLVAVEYNPFVCAVHHSFAEHRPLVISPDHIWLLICHGFASHVNNNAETLRNRIVDFKGKKTLTLHKIGFRKGCPDNPWPEVFADFAKQIRKEIKQDVLGLSLSTTGPVERMAFDVALMDAMKAYFSFKLFTTICGIPSITLEGNTNDWQAILDKARELATFDLEFWLDQLIPILNQFIAASKGDIDSSFWNSIYKQNNASGGPYIHGWINTFFPYLKGSDGTISRKNPLLLNDGIGLSMSEIPSGLGRVAVEWHYDDGVNENVYNMEFCAGFVGIRQNPENKALRPEIGWAVKEQ